MLVTAMEGFPDKAAPDGHAFHPRGFGCTAPLPASLSVSVSTRTIKVPQETPSGTKSNFPAAFLVTPRVRRLRLSLNQDLVTSIRAESGICFWNLLDTSSQAA